MTGDLPNDIVGTNPKFGPLVDHTWLDVDLGKYSNYPSDNNSVRIAPKLSEMWNPDLQQTGAVLIPNNLPPAGPIMAPARSASTGSVIREAKKALMVGLVGHELAGHLRERFSSEDIKASGEELKALVAEQGLLGNVYIDASAFSSSNEAEQFLTKHRTRLARELVVNNSALSRDVISFLANKFHRNVVSSIVYDENVYNRYKSYLVAAGRINPDFVINSKETLRQAFLAAPEASAAPEAPKDEPRLAADVIAQGVSQIALANSDKQRIANENVEFSRVKSIVIFARENLSKGKTGNDVKDMLRAKFAKEDIQAAAKYLALVASDKAVSQIHTVVASKKISETIGDELKKIASRYPIKTIIDIPKTERSAGMEGHFYALNGNKVGEDIRPWVDATVTAMKRGATVEKIRSVWAHQKNASLSKDAVDRIMIAAVNEYNASGAGMQANQTAKPAKIVVEDNEKRSSLPEESTIAVQNKEYQDFFAGSGTMEVSLDPILQKEAKTEVGDMFNGTGFDSFLGK